MKITPLNEFETLFKVEEVYPAEIIAECQQQDINSISWEPLGEGVYSQAATPRRMLVCESPNVFSKLDNYVRDLIPAIRDITNKPISTSHTRVWADYPGYAVSRHLDNIEGVYITLQVYLNEGDETLGTHFSNSPVGMYQHAIPYRPNFGYIMVNTDYNNHGMIKPVPDNFIRLSSYTWFKA
jgi:hypothetical protein